MVRDCLMRSLPKKTSVVLFVTLFLLNSVIVFAASTERKTVTAGNLRNVGRLNLFDERDDSDYSDISGGTYMGPQIANTAAPARQVCYMATTWRDYQHNSTIGRQLVYPGFYEAIDTNYVYMVYTKTYQIGPTYLNEIRYAVFNWTRHDWEDTCCDVNAGFLANSRYCNLDCIPANPGDTSLAIPVFHYSQDDISPIWTYWAYPAGICTDQFIMDSLSGPPCVPDVQTGFCGDVDALSTPYIWPKVDVQRGPGDSIVYHVASCEHSCGEPTVPPDAVEVLSSVYYRRIAPDTANPASGVWEGPVFMDSVYSVNQHVVAEDFGSNVYYVYLKPMYYYCGSPHPCEATGLGHYQQTNDVVYCKSQDYGRTWTEFRNITRYKDYGFEDKLTEPANSDLTCLVDPSNVLHIIWGTPNRDPENICAMYYAMKMWHWDSQNDCISIAYDAAHPRYFDGNLSAWDEVVTQQNISWCDDRLYITFVRYGAHPVGDTSEELGAGPPGADTLYQVADIMVVASDISGGMGRTWTEAFNLTNTDGTNCAPGTCPHEVYPFMAPYMHDSLMIEYIQDLDAGAWFVGEGSLTDNPVMFMTWPCFSMADMGLNCDYTTSPDSPIWDEVVLAAYGDTTNCILPASYTDSVILFNMGNVDIIYTATSNNPTWLTVDAGAIDTARAGTGPKGLPDSVVCASPAIIKWTANSATLAEGPYTGTISVDIDDPNCTDFEIEVNLIVWCPCKPSWAEILSGCWSVHVWPFPQAGHQDSINGDMRFYACGGDSCIHPLYDEALIVGWNGGGKCFSMMMGEEYYYSGMKSLDDIEVTAVGNPSMGQGYWHAEGSWCTWDSSVHGTVEYIVPGHQDTAVLIEKVTVWNETGTEIDDLLIGEGIDWDVRSDSLYDGCGFDATHMMLYQMGCRQTTNVYAGMAPYCGYDQNIGGAVVDNHDYIYPSYGYKPDSIYQVLDTLEGKFTLFTDSCTDLNTIYRFWEGSLGIGDTLSFCKIKAVSAVGLDELKSFIDKAYIFIQKYGLCCPPPVLDGRVFHNRDGYVPDDGDPTGTVWDELYPKYDDQYEVVEWIDNGDGILSYCDTLVAQSFDVSPDTIKQHILRVTTTITAMDTTMPWDTVYLDYLNYNPMNDDLLTDYLTGSYWHEVYPDYCIKYEVIDVVDNGNGILDSLDLITIHAITGPDSGSSFEFQVLNLATDIISTSAEKPCYGICGSANGDGSVNVADAVWIINYIFTGSNPPQPVLACGDVNNDCRVNISDAIKVINYVFASGEPPEQCCPCHWGSDGDCCPFVPPK